MSNSVMPASSGSPSSGGIPPSAMPVVLAMRMRGDSEQEVTLTGTLRPFVAEEMGSIRSSLEQAAWSTRGTLCVNLKRLKYMNNVAFLELNRFVRWASSSRPDLRVKFIISSVIPWAIRKFQVIAELYPNVAIEVYDRAFYPSQEVMEDDSFIKVLRLQAKIIWKHERVKLGWHGLRPGLKIADIACGCGDFALMLQEDYRPQYLVGLDHSKPFLRYARQLIGDYGLENIEYQYGDAAAILMPDNSFDFVTCRLSLQVFNKPDRILQELVRICRPGGRVYVTNEQLSGICGFPNQESIRWTYCQTVEQAGMLGMDMDIGLRSRHLLLNAGLEDIKVHLIEISNMNTDPADFARVVESWTEVVDQVAEKAGASQELRDRLRAGHRDHILSITSSQGFSVWPIFAASGRKPFRQT